MNRILCGIVPILIYVLFVFQVHAAESGPQVQRVNPGQLQTANVSARMANEIIVPYANPKIIRFEHPDTTASVTRDGSSIYISTGDEEFVQLIIKNADTPDRPGISLLLIPVDDMPAQHIRFEPLEDANSITADVNSASQLSSADYEDMLRELVREAAKDLIPSGYSKDANWNGTRIQVGEIVGEPAKRLIGNTLAVEYFILKNTGAEAVELSEPNFKYAGVRAISFLDAHILAPGSATRLVWVKDRASRR